jgi:hypothetical protein
MYRIFFTLAFFILITNIGESQQNPDRVGFKDANNNLKTQNIFVKVKPYKSNLEDSPMMFVEDKQGYVIPKSGEHTETLFLNYNILLDQTVFRKDGQQYSIESKFLDSLIILEEGKQSVYCYKKIKAEEKIKLMKILSAGSYTLYSAIDATLVQPDYNPVLMTGSQNFTIDAKTHYYVEDAENVLLLPNKAKKLIASQDFSREFKKLVKKKSPRLRREKDILAFFNAINQ